MTEDAYNLTELSEKEILFIRKSVNNIKVLMLLDDDPSIKYEEILFVEKLVEKIDKVYYG
jgi:hypothetical protein